MTTATYSPDDNKLRLYPAARLDAETYARVKAAGFAWAPKQELFVAPMWTPQREDLALELAGSIDDEDTSLCERAEDRADRFEDYSTKRAIDAERAHAAVAEVAGRFEFGQPILVGHHSEAKARKDAARIESGMRRAVGAFETSQYWARRAKGAIRAAKYKEKPEVRARRIKTIEADKRKQERARDQAAQVLAYWQRPELTLSQALQLADALGYSSRCYSLADFPRDPPASQYEGEMSLYSALSGGVITIEQARADRAAVLPRSIASAERWIAHYENRLSYERAMLDDQGASHLLEKPKRAPLPPLLNYRAPEGLDTPNIYQRGAVVHLAQIEMTAAEFAAINKDYKGTRLIDGSHRIRTCVDFKTHGLRCVFLTDSKAHPRPDTKAKAEEPAPAVAAMLDREMMARAARPPVELNPDAAKFADMKQALRAGITTVSAPQLFPTPEALADRMADLLDARDDSSILEPSAGTGRLLDAVGDAGAEVVAVEINAGLADRLRRCYPQTTVKTGDFLSMAPDTLGKFDRVLMNPPFGNAQDIAHIRHALTFVKPGGRLVALCAAGSRQRAALASLGHWEDLPPGSFASEGTGVNVALLVVEVSA